MSAETHTQHSVERAVRVANRRFQVRSLAGSRCRHTRCRRATPRARTRAGGAMDDARIDRSRTRDVDRSRVDRRAIVDRSRARFACPNARATPSARSHMDETARLVRRDGDAMAHTRCARHPRTRGFFTRGAPAPRQSTPRRRTPTRARDAHGDARRATRIRRARDAVRVRAGVRARAERRGAM